MTTYIGPLTSFVCGGIAVEIKQHKVVKRWLLPHGMQQLNFLLPANVVLWFVYVFPR